MHQLRWLNWLGHVHYLESFDPKRYHALHKKIDTRVNKVFKNKKGLLTEEEFDVLFYSYTSGYANSNQHIQSSFIERIIFERDERILTTKGGILIGDLYAGKVMTSKL